MIKFLKRVIRKIRKILLYAFYYLCWVLPINNKKIIADNFNGRGYSDNPKAIIDELLIERNEYTIIWVLDKNSWNEKLPNSLKKVKFNSLRHFYQLATSKIWIDNVRMPFFIRKRKKQYYIQTWHAGIGLKHAEKAISDVLPNSYIKCAKNDSSNADLFISCSGWQTNYYRENFWYSGKILEKGLPRNDILFKREKHQKISICIRKKLNIKENTRILLYAPTFRDDRSTDAYDIDFEKLLKKLEKKTSSKWTILIKLHPNISNFKLNTNNNIINVSNGYNLNDLLITSDLLITDYSSLMFDYSYLLKPTIIYASDIDKMNNVRGFSFDIFSLPFPVAKNNQELLSVIDLMNQEDLINKIKIFNDELQIKETGKASYYVCNIIKDITSK